MTESPMTIVDEQEQGFVEAEIEVQTKIFAPRSSLRNLRAKSLGLRPRTATPYSNSDSEESIDWLAERHQKAVNAWAAAEGRIKAESDAADPADEHLITEAQIKAAAAEPIPPPGRVHGPQRPGWTREGSRVY